MNPTDTQTTREEIERIAQALLYEGYLLYPYRPSVKNRQRWTFGGVYPHAWCEVQQTGDTSAIESQCLVAFEQGSDGAVPRVSAQLRFLQIVQRQVGRLLSPVPKLSDAALPDYEPVESLQVGARLLHTWQEAIEHEFELGDAPLNHLVCEPRMSRFALAAAETIEPVQADNGAIEAVLIRRRQALAGMASISAETLGPGLYRLTVRVENNTPAAADASREQAQLAALASAHLAIRAEGGRFISLVDPPAERQLAAGACRQRGLWPVLVGRPELADTMLASPIILYDYPQIAPESPGDLFDGTEIDEILSLRIMTLSEDEKQLARAVDDRARALLERTDTLDPERLAALHGTRRQLRPVEDEHAPTG